MENLKVFLYRWDMALLLVFGIYSSNGYSFYDMFVGNFDVPMSVLVLTAVVLLSLALWCIRSTLRSIGWLGSILGSALVAASIWVMTDLDIYNLQTDDLRIYAGQIALATVLAIGMTWGHFRGR